MAGLRAELEKLQRQVPMARLTLPCLAPNGAFQGRWSFPCSSTVELQKSYETLSELSDSPYAADAKSRAGIAAFIY